MERIIKQVIWTSRASKDLRQITSFYSKLYGWDKALDIAFQIRKETEIFENSEIDINSIGAPDEFFKHLKRDYRKYIFHHCKITYRVGNDTIYIVRVFDTRQNPSKNL